MSINTSYIYLIIIFKDIFKRRKWFWCCWCCGVGVVGVVLWGDMESERLSDQILDDDVRRERVKLVQVGKEEEK